MLTFPFTQTLKILLENGFSLEAHALLLHTKNLIKENFDVAKV